MEPLAISVIESKLSRDSETHKRAFVVKYFSPTEEITQKTRDLPIKIQIFEAKLSVPSLLGYLLLLLSGPIGAFIGGLMSHAILGVNTTFVCVGFGALIAKTNPRLWRPGRLLMTRDGKISSSA